MRLMFAARAMDRSAGGVQRMITAVMNEMVTRGHEIDLFSWDVAEAEAFFPMAREIAWHHLDMGHPKKRASGALVARRVGVVRDLVKRRRPQAIVCFQDGPFRAMRLYTAGLGIPLVASERNAPTRFDHTSARRWRDPVLLSLRLAARVTVQFESYRALYPRLVRDRITVIPNPVPAAERQARPDVPDKDGRFRVLSVGRLGYQKNYEVLVHAFAKIASAFPLWDLAIVGGGEDLDALRLTISEMPALKNRVTLPGPTHDVASWYESAHIFCLPSRWEGFPNALAEALAHGLPGVGFADCAGVRDLVAPDLTGLLAEGNGNPDSLAGVLSTLMADARLRAEMGVAATESVKYYNPKRSFDLWERMLAEIARP